MSYITIQVTSFDDDKDAVVRYGSLFYTYYAFGEWRSFDGSVPNKRLKRELKIYLSNKLKEKWR